MSPSWAAVRRELSPRSNWPRPACACSCFDEKLAWEKPCGGGLTYKAYNQYPFLIDNSTPKRLVTETVLAAPRRGEVSLKLDDPLLIYSRFDLNRMLLERAERAGAQIEKARVPEMSRYGSRLAAAHQSAESPTPISASWPRARAIRCATWAPNCGRKTPCRRWAITCPATRTRIDIQFLPQLEGYIWVFPRCGHLSVGICGKGEPAGSLRKRLEQYMSERGISWKGASFYSHLLPSLDTASWRKNRVAGEGWMAVGDAAGLVDPITGEGLYYAIRSADLAARALLSEVGEPGRASWRTTARCCAAISRPTWSSARAWPSASSWAASCSARCPRAWCSSPAAARASRPSCRTCSPAGSPTWA